MKKHLAIAAITGLVSTLGAQAATTYSFTSSGWSDGGVLTGTFTAEDLDTEFNSADGFITHGYGDAFTFAETILLDEITAFEATYTSATITTSFDFSSIEGPDSDLGPGFAASTGSGNFSYDLGAGNLLGDGTGVDIDGFRPAEGINLRNDDYVLRLGQARTGQACDGLALCGFIFNAEDVPEDGIGGPAIFSDDLAADILPEEDDLVADALAGTFQAIVVTEGDTPPDPIVTLIGDGTELDPFLPAEDDPSDGFDFDLTGIRLLPGEIFWFDPEIAVGYTYTVVGDTFAEVELPSLAQVADIDGKYTLTYVNADTGETNIVSLTADLLDGENYEFEAGADVTSFTITDIGVSSPFVDGVPGLDPTDPFAFVTGLAFTNGTATSVKQTPIIETVAAVPLPAGVVLLFSALGGLAIMRRRGA